MNKSAMKFGEELQEKLLDGRVKMDNNGHFGRSAGPKTLEEIVRDRMDRLMYACQLGSSFSLLKEEEVSDVTIPIQSAFGHTCNICGEHPRYIYNGEVLSVATPCPYANGIPEFSVQIPVPSGKIAFANDLTALVFDQDEMLSMEDGSQASTMKLAHAFEQKGMLYLYVGNNGPSVYRLSDTGLSITTPGYIATTEEPWEDEYVYPEGEYKGTIYTDAWTVTAMDYDKAVAASEDVEDEEIHFDAIVNVKPGVWEFSSLYSSTKYDANDHTTPFHFSQARWAGEC